MTQVPIKTNSVVSSLEVQRFGSSGRILGHLKSHYGRTKRETYNYYLISSSVEVVNVNRTCFRSSRGAGERETRTSGCVLLLERERESEQINDNLKTIESTKEMIYFY